VETIEELLYVVVDLFQPPRTGWAVSNPARTSTAKTSRREDPKELPESPRMFRHADRSDPPLGTCKKGYRQYAGIIRTASRPQRSGSLVKTLPRTREEYRFDPFHTIAAAPARRAREFRNPSKTIVVSIHRPAE